MPGRAPPPHLSPFVDNEAEGYLPEQAEYIKRLRGEIDNAADVEEATMGVRLGSMLNACTFSVQA